VSFQDLKIKTKLLIICISLIVLPVIVLGFSSYNVSKNAIYKEIEEKLVSQVEGKASELKFINSGLETVLVDAIKLMTAKVFPGKIVEGNYAEIEDGELVFVSNGDKRPLSIGNHELIDHITEIIGEGFVTTVFKVEKGEALRVTTSVTKPDGERAVGTILGDFVYNIVVKEKKEYLGEANILGIDYHTIYTPVLNEEGEVTCILFAGIKSSLFYDEFKKQLSATKVGKTGYMYVMDGKGTLVIHPKSEGKNISKYDFIKEMIEKKNGLIVYPWEGRNKILAYKYYEPEDWILASGSYLEDFNGPVIHIRNIVLLISIISIVVGILVILWFEKQISILHLHPLSFLLGFG